MSNIDKSIVMHFAARVCEQIEGAGRRVSLSKMQSRQQNAITFELGFLFYTDIRVFENIAYSLGLTMERWSVTGSYLNSGQFYLVVELAHDRSNGQNGK